MTSTPDEPLPVCDVCYEKIVAVGRVTPDQLAHRDPNYQVCMCCGLLPGSVHDN